MDEKEPLYVFVMDAGRTTIVDIYEVNSIANMRELTPIGSREFHLPATNNKAIVDRVIEYVMRVKGNDDRKLDVYVPANLLPVLEKRILKKVPGSKIEYRA